MTLDWTSLFIALHDDGKIAITAHFNGKEFNRLYFIDTLGHSMYSHYTMFNDEALNDRHHEIGRQLVNYAAAINYTYLVEQGDPFLNTIFSMSMKDGSWAISNLQTHKIDGGRIEL